MATVVYLVSDLLFTSKIRETATQLGHSVAAARDVAGLVAAAREARVAIVDLRRPDALQALDALAADAATSAVVRIGFVDHERAEVFEAARARGCLALAKGKFTSDLGRLLSSA